MGRYLMNKICKVLIWFVYLYFNLHFSMHFKKTIDILTTNLTLSKFFDIRGNISSNNFFDEGLYNMHG